MPAPVVGVPGQFRPVGPGPIDWEDKFVFPQNALLLWTLCKCLRKGKNITNWANKVSPGSSLPH